MSSNRHFTRWQPSIAAIAMASTLACAPSAFAAEPAAPAPAASDGSEIVVTARKREENLLSTPIAISAVTAADIEKKGIISVANLVEATPGINVTSTNSGRNDRSFQQISLRGFTPSTTTSTLTATFIDGVPVASATAINAISDPARIEVLKGPQNAYFGRNAFAGAINVVNKLPGSSLGGGFNASVYSRKGYDVGGSLEGPLLGDVLGFRLSGRAIQRGGSYINAANPSERLGDQETRNGSLLLVFKPSTQLTVKAFGLYNVNNDGPSAQGMLSAYELRANNGAINIPALSGNTNGTVILPSLANCTLSGFTAGVSATEARVNNPFICGAIPALPAGFSPAQNTYINAVTSAALANGASRYIDPKNGVRGYGLKSRYYHLHLNIDWELGETGLTLSSLTGYNNERYSELADLDNYNNSALANPLATAANGLVPFWTFPFLVERKNKDFSQELRVSYDKGGAFKAMLGGSYLYTYSAGDLVSIQAETISGAPRSAGSLSPPAQVRTLGVFGSLSYDVTPEFNISAEGRFQRDRVYAFTGGRTLTVSPAIAAQYGLPTGTFQPVTTFYNKAYDNFMPRVILTYKFSPELMVYGSWSKAANVSSSSFNTAFLSGSAGEIAAAQAINLSVVTEPEKLSNFEIGLKGRLFDNRVRFALAAYAAEWKNQYNSRTSILLDTTITPPRTAIVSGVANSGRTLVKGVELDLSAEPVDGLTINAAGAINDTNIRSFADPSISKLTGVIGDAFKGNSLPLTSKYSFNIGAQLAGKLGGRPNAGWFVRGDLSYKSRQFVDAANLTWIKGRAVVNGRIGVNLDNISLEAFAFNLFNNKNYTAVAQNNVLEPSFALSSKAFGYLNVGLPELRIFGVKAGVKF